MSNYLQMTPAQKVKYMGFVSLSEAARMVGKGVQTLRNWHRDTPELFEIVILGCIAKTKEDEQ